MKKTQPTDFSKAVSVMGQKKFNAAVLKEMQSGMPPGLAMDSVAKKKAQGLI